MSSSLRRRIEQLERKMQIGVITLVMSDGRTRQVQQRRIFPMICGRHPMDDDFRAVIDSVSDDGLKVGMGHLCELVRVMHVAGISADAAIE